MQYRVTSFWEDILTNKYGLIQFCKAGLVLLSVLSTILKMIQKPCFYITRIEDFNSFLDVKKQLDLGFMGHILKQLFSNVFGNPRDNTETASTVHKCPIVQCCCVVRTCFTEQKYIFNGCLYSCRVEKFYPKRTWISEFFSRACLLCLFRRSL